MVGEGFKPSPTKQRRSAMGNELVPEQVIEPKIFMIRGHKVMLSRHLAELYEGFYPSSKKEYR